MAMLATAAAAPVNGTSPSVRRLEAKISCTPPPNAVTMPWYYESKDKKGGPLTGCTLKDRENVGEWIMLNAYLGGGKKGVHYKYTNDPNDPECLVDWVYYAKNDPTYVMERVKGRLAQDKDKKKRTWCALPVYRKGGKQGFQWDFCVWNE